MESILAAEEVELSELVALEAVEQELLPLYPVRPFTARVLCREIFTVPDPESTVVDAIEHVQQHRLQEIQDHHKAQEQQRKREEQLLVAQEAKEAEELAAASGGKFTFSGSRILHS